MGIGFSILLIAAGAILAFAVEATVAGIDIEIIGWILMAAGALGLILTMVIFIPRRNRSVTATHTVDAPPSTGAAQRVTDQETRTDGV